MLLTSVVLILQEILEAALLFSLLAVLSRQRGQRVTWMPLGLLAGLALGWAYAAHMATISSWFDYVGQEVVNAMLHAAIAVVVMALSWAIGGPRETGTGRLFALGSALAVALAVTREGSEIIVYLGGFASQQDKLPAVLIGSAIGAGIGLSIGALLYYGLLALRSGWRSWAPLILLALFTGNMLAQGALQMIQADLLPSGPVLWDSSSLLPESGAAGRLLYALVGYESHPSLLQVSAYACGVLLVLVLFLVRSRKP